MNTFCATVQSIYVLWQTCKCVFKSHLPSVRPSTHETPRKPLDRSSETFILLSFTNIGQLILVLTSDNNNRHCTKTHILVCFCPYRESNSKFLCKWKIFLTTDVEKNEIYSTSMYKTLFPYVFWVSRYLIIAMCIHLVTCRSVRLFSSQKFSEYNRRLPNKTNASVVSTKMAFK